jgi:DNA-binding MurR/RpiR family transcriptional regulator
LPKRYSLKKKQIESRQEDILGETISYIMENLHYTHEKIDPQQFWDTARMLMDPQAHLYITGQRTSYPLAYLFHLLIMRLRPEATLIGPEISMLPDKLSGVGPQDVLLSIFRHPYGKQTLKVSQHFAEKNARILLISDSEFSPASGLATIQLTVPSEGLSIFNSFSAVTALLESLNIAALKFCTEGVIDRLESGEKLLRDFEVFCPGKGLDASQIRKLKDIQHGQE